MANEFEKTRLWRSTLGLSDGNNEKACERLRTSYMRFREGVALLAAEIGSSLPTYTVHDISHIDALWEVADTIAGKDYPLNPLEGFVFGGAILLHDLGMGLASWPGREEGLEKHELWEDMYASISRRNPSLSEEHVRHMAISELLRLLHASHAESLTEIEWKDDSRNSTHRLLEDEALRFHAGPLIGRIAHSHWWGVDTLTKHFGNPIGPPTGYPKDWTIHPLRLACLLRAADAAHLDDRRAPRLLRAARNLKGESRNHWVFQGHLTQVVEVDGRLRFTAIRPFGIEDAEAWWTAYETLQMVDGELHSVDALLADTSNPRFQARGVSGVQSPTRLADEFLPVKDWEPVNAELKVGDVARLVDRLGGRALYGGSPSVPLRELIQNASDAVLARRKLDNEAADWGEIVVRMGHDDHGHWLEVEDTGLGMSRAVLTGPLLDFGESYWTSPLCRHENPGLLSSGFEPSGQFGIGFFSVFMWGDRVEVTSRRYDQARTDIRTLRFDTGLSARPVLLDNQATPHILKNGGTVVRIWLKDDPSSEAGILGSTGGAARSLSDICRFIAPALPVSLSVEECGARERVVVANDWQSLSGRELGDRLAVLRDGRYPWDHAPSDQAVARLREVRDTKGNLLGRIYLACSHLPHVSDGCIVVGGVRATSLGHIGGILVGATEVASRSEASPLLDFEQLKSWATEQGKLIIKEGSQSKHNLQELAASVFALGGETGDLPICRTHRGWMSYVEAIDWLRELEEVVLASDFGELAIDALEVEGQLAPNLALINPGGRLFVQARDLSSMSDWPFGQSSRASQFHERHRTQAYQVILAAASAWDLSTSKVHENIEYSTDSHRISFDSGLPAALRIKLLGTAVIRRPKEGDCVGSTET